jgi:ferrous iron transport protein B
LGLVSALVIAFILKKIIRTKEKGFLVLEMPDFKSPRWQNVWITVYEKVRIFVWDAGKVILAISVILWALASFGPGDSIEKAEKESSVQISKKSWSEEEKNQFIASAKLEKSYMGIMGKTLELYTLASLPYLDSFCFALSLIATMLAIKKYIDNWPIWIFTNAIYITMYIYKAAYLTAFLYGLFFVLAFKGWMTWKKQIAIN